MVSSRRQMIGFVAFVALTAAFLTGAARIGVTSYFSSARGKAMVSERLGTTIGMPVEVSDFSVGDEHASFQFRVLDPMHPQTEVLHVASASADVNTADLIAGRVAPSTLKFSGASLTLRVNSHGQIITPIPMLPGPRGDFPAIAIDKSRIYIRQEGKADFVLTGVSFNFEPAGKMVKIEGTVADPNWGEWTIRGEYRRDTRTGWLEFATPGIPLTTQAMTSLPFARPELFDGLNDLGHIAVSVRLALGANRTVHPVIAINPAISVLGSPISTTTHLKANSDCSPLEHKR